ncbi:hypothetical protein BJ170DRAFT_684788 [Xylariales sp. AK1849]|nr:hypothetical protein BJ170DRAFT_684788 [Xylariales sp. AK1849]
MPTKSTLGHKRTGSGRIESKEGYTSHGDAYSSPEMSGRLQASESPIARPHSRYLHRHSPSISSSRQSPESPRDSKIPRPKSTTQTLVDRTNGRQPPGAQTQSPKGLTPRMRQPMGLKAAFALAEKQEAREQSDSDGTIDLQQAFNMANAEANQLVQGSPSPAPRSYRRRESVDSRSNQYFGSAKDSDLGQQLKQFDRKHQLNGSGGPLDGLFTTRNRVGPKVAETAHTLAKKASDSSLGGSPESRRASQWGANIRKQPSRDLLDWENRGRHSPLPSVDFAPLPPVELDSDGGLANSPFARPTLPSPEKSYNWHLDADFTAGDLQVSDSPRIRLGGNNSSAAGDSSRSNSPHYRRSNDYLDQIRELEIEAANAIIPEEDPRPVSKRTNSRLDEIRALEMESLSKRAVASSRLDEIRAKNSEARSLSPEAAKPSSNNNPRRDSLSTSGEKGTKEDKTPVSPKVSPQVKANIGETIPDTPITVFRNSSNESVGKAEVEKVKPQEDRPTMPSRDDSHDILRRLARATSSSPPPAQDPPNPSEAIIVDGANPKPTSEERETGRPRSTRLDRQPRNLEAKGAGDRLTVGFVGLQKVSSSDSLQEKRRSLANSESDPTDRIEAEMKLFDALDNYSEKGSIRVPSRGPSEASDLVEETPRPTKVVDPLSQPTPRVTGAYVETPATVKAERLDDWVDEELEVKPVKALEMATGLRSRKSSMNAKESQESRLKREGSNVSEKFVKATGRSVSAPTGRRARSMSRRRRPLINTAKIPTVKEDLRSILREHRIDDSTIDDLDELLANPALDHEELEKMVDDTVLKLEDDLNVPGLTDHERELQAFDRMSKSLKTGLLGIRSAKQGIERLEDKVAHSEHKDPSSQVFADLGLSSSANIPMLGLKSSEAAVYVSVPSLYRRDPNFALTRFGILSLVLTIWFTIESAFCHLYVTPYDCRPDVPCDWSPNEPYFPYAAPYMLDEWTTGGKARALAWHIGEEVGDRVADATDWVTGNDFTKEEEMYMNVWARKRHRRRLRKRGLTRKWIEPPQFRDQFRSWREAWFARQRAIEEGAPAWGDESMGADERL